jgi:hypothetical protein
LRRAVVRHLKAVVVNKDGDKKLVPVSGFKAGP